MSEHDGGRPRGYVLFAWSPAGYSVRELEGEPPRVGDEVADGDRTLVITKVAPSPLPGDPRPCAYTSGR